MESAVDAAVALKATCIFGIGLVRLLHGIQTNTHSEHLVGNTNILGFSVILKDRCCKEAGCSEAMTAHASKQPR